MSSPAPTPIARRRRKPLLLLLAASCLLLAGVWSVEWWRHGRFEESTDNAYVAGDLVPVMPQIAGTVVSVHADETDRVEAGATLIELDPGDALIAQQQAEATLAQAVRDVRTLFAQRAALAAQVQQRASELARMREDLGRRQRIGDSGAVTAEEIEHARNGVRAAEAALSAAREQLAANAVQTDGSCVADHPTVQRAASRLEEAMLNSARTRLPAPVGGYVARRAAQLGARVAAGTPLMAIVPLDAVWVEANFKEAQLRGLRIGQPAWLTADLYGSDVRYRGHVVGLGMATGAATALLPAQNATGNWIKVVQRVPVRIALEAAELRAHPLRLGLSMNVSIDTRDRSGALLAAEPRRAPVLDTGVYARDLATAAAHIRSIIAANLGADTPLADGEPLPAGGGCGAPGTP
ncbi:HlyD family efflux transporter periplasmic adaptor subunit [Plasticicumulans acidivorans]|uniref:Membrane fusion protein (Multidrug efflux system) n=1 Tax=Plasticicumulans acidivorans TaxID=886464 RepID=A0A317MR24_9GAMM|nr:HlyD family efflux transporter periplasmic adaptor subunit [Plasticicumulans acidivorans]PWV59136.1 membrane fusion protein (multidrug efflux system) [Plasticicumulans acidivorans]